MHQPRRSRLAPGLVALMIILLGASSAACAGGTAVPVATPPSAAPSAASSPAGPSSYAAWVARQGFGGSSGLREVLKGATWVSDHAADAPVFDIDDWTGVAKGLRAWLQEHPATACWQAYRSLIIGGLDGVVEAFGAAHADRAANQPIPADVAKDLVQRAQATFETPEPTGCP